MLSQPRPPIWQSGDKHLAYTDVRDFSDECSCVSLLSYLFIKSSQMSSGSMPRDILSVMKSTTSWLDNTSQIPSHARIMKSHSGSIMS